MRIYEAASPLRELSTQVPLPKDIVIDPPSNLGVLEPLYLFRFVEFVQVCLGI